VVAILVKAREAAGMTQRELATELNRPHSFVGRIEAGERRVDIIEFIEIARILRTDPKRLFEQLLS
jgi:transcriptional regulator with XRE-family HTH domain